MRSRSTTSGFGCNTDHCICGPDPTVVVPLRTTIVSGTTTSDCSYAPPTTDNCPAAAAPAVTAQCFPTTNLPTTATYNPADITPVASPFCNSVLVSVPLSAAAPTHVWLSGSPTLLASASLIIPVASSCSNFQIPAACETAMGAIMSQCPGQGGAMTESCAIFGYRIATFT